MTGPGTCCQRSRGRDTCSSCTAPLRTAAPTQQQSQHTIQHKAKDTCTEPLTIEQAPCPEARHHWCFLSFLSFPFTLVFAICQRCLLPLSRQVPTIKPAGSTAKHTGVTCTLAMPQQLLLRAKTVVTAGARAAGPMRTSPSHPVLNLLLGALILCTNCASTRIIPRLHQGRWLHAHNRCVQSLKGRGRSGQGQRALSNAWSLGFHDERHIACSHAC